MKRRIFILIALVVLISLIYILSFAKFKSNSLWDYFISSKDFYFESDYLDIDEKENVNYMWDGNDIIFNLKNYNNDSFTKDNISYTVSCETDNEDVICHLNNTENSRITSMINGNDKRNVNVSFNLVSSVDYSDVNVYITVKSTNPYEKVLKGKYVLHKEDSLTNNISYDVLNNKIYNELIINNKNDERKCVEVTIGDDNIKVLQDDNMFDLNTNSNNYINNFKININKNSTSSIKLFNSEDTNITKDIITVIECQ